MKIATWNVNSLKVRLPHVLDWLAEARPDVLCLQELKLPTTAFPFDAIRAAGYEAQVLGQKTYNGVALLSRTPATDVVLNLPGLDDPQARLVSATVDGVRIIGGYFPNGQAPDSDKFAYKLDWLATLNRFVAAELARHPALVLTGDFNIAPQPVDAHPDWPHEIHVSAPERDAFEQLRALGLTDAFRLFEQPPDAYSWWDYRMGAFRRNFGLRIDHMLVSHALRPRVTACAIDKAPRKLERPSDHAPVWLTLDAAP